MSHYTGGHGHSKGYATAKKAITHYLRHCFGCGGEMVERKGNPHQQKICEDCKTTMTPDEIRSAYARHYQAKRAMFKEAAKPIPASEQRFIIGSPFRKAMGV